MSESDWRQEAENLLQRQFEERFGSVDENWVVDRPITSPTFPIVIKKAKRNPKKSQQEQPDDETLEIEPKISSHKFLHGKVSALTSKAPPAKQSGPTKDSESTSVEQQLLKHDAELQKLLRESSLLKSTDDIQSQNRQKSLQLHLETLGFNQVGDKPGNVPMAIQVGISRKRRQRQQKLIEEAKAANIVLPKSALDQNKKPKRKKWGESGLHELSVGKFQSGCLKISKSKIKAISSSSTDSIKKKKKRGR